MSAITDLNYEDYLSDNEKQTLKKINSTSNKLHKQFLKQQDFFNLSLNDIIHTWSSHHLEMIEEIIYLLNSMEDYESNNIMGYIGYFVTGIIKIINKKSDRLIYLGITLIILSICFYFMSITN